jgi:hypothetical protein
MPKRSYKYGDNWITSASNAVSNVVGKGMDAITRGGSAVSNAALYLPKRAGNAVLTKGAQAWKKRKKR